MTLLQALKALANEGDGNKPITRDDLYKALLKVEEEDIAEEEE